MPTRRGFFASLAALFVGARFWKSTAPQYLQTADRFGTLGDPETGIAIRLVKYWDPPETDPVITRGRGFVKFDTLEGIAGEQLTAGDCVYLHPDGFWRKS